MGNFIIAIDLGGTSAKLALITPQGDLKHKWEVETNIQDEGRFIVPALIQSIQEALKELKLTLDDVLGIGMGTPGSVDPKAQTVIGAYNLNWKTTQRLGDAFREAFGLPFAIDNDANVAALGEQAYGAGANEPNVVMVTLGTGVGGGLINEGRLIHGEGAAGEIGHLAVETTDPILCTCGKWGCLESVASATGVMNLVAKYLPTYEGRTSVKEEGLTAKEVFDLAKDGDAFALEIVDRYAKYLALALSHCANTLNPSKIIIGGGVSQAGDFLLNKLNEYYDTYIFPPIKGKSTLCLAELGNDAGIYGAAQLINNRKLN